MRKSVQAPKGRIIEILAAFDGKEIQERFGLCRETMASVKRGTKSKVSARTRAKIMAGYKAWKAESAPTNGTEAPAENLRSLLADALRAPAPVEVGVAEKLDTVTYALNRVEAKLNALLKAWGVTA